MKKLRHITIAFVSLLMVVVSVSAYQKNISLSLESIAPSIDAGDQATFILDFKTTGSTQNLKEVTVKIDLQKILR